MPGQVRPLNARNRVNVGMSLSTPANIAFLSGVKPFISMDAASRIEIIVTKLAILLLALLEIKHFLFDFVFQTSYQLKNKRTYAHPGGLLHAALHGLATGIVLTILSISWPILVSVSLAESVFHYHVDWTKEHLVRRTAGVEGAFFWVIIGLDQLLHQISYICITAVLLL